MCAVRLLRSAAQATALGTSQGPCWRCTHWQMRCSRQQRTHVPASMCRQLLSQADLVVSSARNTRLQHRLDKLV